VQWREIEFAKGLWRSSRFVCKLLCVCSDADFPRVSQKRLQIIDMFGRECFRRNQRISFEVKSIIVTDYLAQIDYRPRNKG